jgi:hypothetical protein
MIALYWNFNINFIRVFAELCAGPVNYLRTELIVPTTAATGRRAGTNVAATGRILFATGRAFLTAGRAFLVNQLFWSGAAEEKDGAVFISKTGYTLCNYNIFMLFTNPIYLCYDVYTSC